MPTHDFCDLGEPPYPTDRERQLAIEIMRAHLRGERGPDTLMTTLAKGLARYRIELGGKP